MLEHLLPVELRDFGLHDLDLEQTPLQEMLDQALTPSLMAPSRFFSCAASRRSTDAASMMPSSRRCEHYFAHPNPDALILFIADHIGIPADPRRMEMTDKDRYQRIRETLGELCTVVELARVDEAEASRWIAEAAAARGVKIDTDAARELVDALGGDMMMISGELEKLILYAGEKKRITLGDVETMVLAAKQRTLYELTDAISAKDRPRALAIMDAILSTGDGDEAAIGHLYMLAKTFRQMLVISEHNVRDSRALWQVLWQGFRVPPVRRRRHRAPGAPLQIAPRTDAGHPAHRARRPGPALQPPQQTPGAGKTRPRTLLRAQGRRDLALATGRIAGVKGS